MGRLVSLTMGTGQLYNISAGEEYVEQMTGPASGAVLCRNARKYSRYCLLGSCRGLLRRKSPPLTWDHTRSDELSPQSHDL